MGAPLGEFEWIAGFEALACFFEPGFLQVPLGRALVVGCGRSALSRELAGVFREVVSVDCEPAVVEAMREAEPSLRWVCADCCSGPEMREILEAEGGPFDAVVDKGTLDAVMCVEGMAAALLLECHQALKPGGVYLCASLRGRALLDELFRAGGPCDWEYQAFPIHVQEGPAEEGRAQPPGPFTMAVLRRPAAPGPAPEPGALRAHCERALDAFFAEQSPLLTPERERALRGAFDGEARPLAEAYGLLFAGAERDEYSLEDFLEDAAACAGSRGDPGRMSADEAVEFLRSNQ